MGQVKSSSKSGFDGTAWSEDEEDAAAADDVSADEVDLCRLLPMCCVGFLRRRLFDGC